MAAGFVLLLSGCRTPPRPSGPVAAAGNDAGAPAEAPLTVSFDSAGPGAHDAVVARSADGTTTATALGRWITVEAKPRPPRTLDNTWIAGLLALSASGRLLAASSADGTIRIWDTERGALLHTTPPVMEWPTHLLFSPDGATLAAVMGSPGHIRLWSTATLAVTTAEGQPHLVRTLVFSADGKMLSGVGDYGGWRWEVATGKLVHFAGSFHPREELAVLSPDGRFVAHTPNYTTLDLFDLETGERVFEHKEPEGSADWLSRPAFLKGGAVVAVDARQGPRWFDTRTGRELPAQGPAQAPETAEQVPVPAMPASAPALAAAAARVRAVAFSSDGLALAVAAGAGQIHILDAGSAGRRGVSMVHTEVEQLLFSPDGATLVSRSGDGSVKFWSRSTGALLGEHALGEREYAWMTAISPDGETLVTGPYDGEVRVWQLHQRDPSRPVRVLPKMGPGSAMGRPLFSPDGRLLALGHEKGPVQLWRVDTGKLWQAVAADNRLPHPLAFSPDGKLLATQGLVDGAIRVWETGSGRLLSTVPFGHAEQGMAQVAFSADHQLMAIRNWLGELRIGSSGPDPAFAAVETSGIGPFAFSAPGGALLAVAGPEVLRCGDCAREPVTPRFGARGSMVRALVQAKSGVWATIDLNETLRLWSETDARVLAAIRFVGDGASGYAFVPDPDATAFELFGDEARGHAVCRQGEQRMAFERCREAFETPGLVARALASATR